jgi:hypothetical protein
LISIWAISVIMGLPLTGISVSNAAARKEKAPFGASSFQIVQELS